MMMKQLHKPVYKPVLVKARPWNDILDFYLRLANNHGWKLQPMIDLIHYIIRTELNERLYGYTRIDILIISIYNPIEHDRESLRLHYSGSMNEWTSVYCSKPFEKMTYVRKYRGEQGIEKFSTFINRIKW